LLLACVFVVGVFILFSPHTSSHTPST
jgi:hypothetical protein